MRATASPGISSTVSMTTKTTPSSTGTASSRRRATNVSTAAGALLVEPDLPEPEVVLHRVHREALHAGPGHHDLLRVVHRDPHHLPGEDVLDLAVELLALGLVEAPPRLLHERVHPRVGIARGVPAGGRDLLAVE